MYFYQRSSILLFIFVTLTYETVLKTFTEQRYYIDLLYAKIMLTTNI